eukprot:GFUD01001113.1.p1 GENE.GFUD01001113.1~~GFUD01001113.1.p1  ORF type:complete len:432 (+),score=63.12 GFUD01001113.1:46-1341(+)
MSLDFVAGCLGGAAGVLSCYPLDTVKVRIQTQDMARGKLYRGTFDCVMKIAKKEGARSLYRGVSCPLFGVAGVSALTFSAYGNVLGLLQHQDSILSVSIAGSAAGLMQSFIVSPMELLKIQMQVCGKTGISDAVRSIYADAGLGGFSRGLGLTILREVPALGIYLASYELFLRKFGDSNVGILMSGGISGILSCSVTFPQDVIKTRLQADSFGEQQKYRGAWHCCQSSWKREGANFLFRGIGSTVIRSFPVTAVTFGVYSFVIRRWGSTQQDISYCDIQELKNERKLKSKMSTYATDGPNIVTIEEPIISASSFVRMYPEQMLWACPSSTKQQLLVATEDSLSHSAVSSFSHYNQFTQFCNKDFNHNHILPQVVITPQQDTEDSPYLNIHSFEDHERWKSCITSQDFLLPANLLSKKKIPDRIYGFYYLVV